VICVRAAGLADTAAIAAGIGALLTRGDCVLLAGQMGAGKTAFTKALAAALGVDDVVTSPTFTLLHSYQGDQLTIHHVDVYRLERTGELEDLALRELLDDGVVVVEWGDAVRDALPDDRIEIGLSALTDDGDGDGDDGHASVSSTTATAATATSMPRSAAARGSARFLEIDPHGRSWDARHERLASALDRWTVPC
jgi:tRNA threonylcarbamoyladenosine biosynthesis protein TsaE